MLSMRFDKTGHGTRDRGQGVEDLSNYFDRFVDKLGGGDVVCAQKPVSDSART